MTRALWSDLRSFMPSAATASSLGTLAAAGAVTLAARAAWTTDRRAALVLGAVVAWLLFLAVRLLDLERPDRTGAVLRYLATQAGGKPVTIFDVMRATGAPSGRIAELLARLEREQFLVSSREVVSDAPAGPGRRHVLRVYTVPAGADTTLRSLADDRSLRVLTLGGPAR